MVVGRILRDRVGMNLRLQVTNWRKRVCTGPLPAKNGEPFLMVESFIITKNLECKSVYSINLLTPTFLFHFLSLSYMLF